MSMRTIGLVAVALVLGLLAFPFEVTVAPEWNVKVIDDSGQAVSGALVQEFATQWTLGWSHKETQCSDLKGEAHFPRHTVRVSVFVRVLKWISGLGPHSSLGPDVKIGAEQLGYDDRRDLDKMFLKWDGWSNHVDAQMTLYKCPDGFSGYHCHSTNEYWLSFRERAQAIVACQSKS